MAMTAGAAMPMPETDETGRSFALLDQAERERVGALLRPLAWIDGLITAVHVTPDALGDDDDWDAADLDAALDWLDLIWNEDKSGEIDELTFEQSAEVVEPVMAHYVHVSDSLLDEPETYRPYLAGFADPLEAASQWAAGFWVGLSLNPEAWEPLLADEDAAPLLLAVLSLVRDTDLPQHVRGDAPLRDVPADRREQMRRSAAEMLPEIVLALHDHTLGLDADLDLDDEDDGTGPDEADIEDAGSHEPYFRAGPKAGRNDPCPCGSGKKYKRCCLDKVN